MTNWIRQNPILALAAGAAILWIAMPPPKKTNRRQIEQAEMKAWSAGHADGYREAKEDYNV